MNDPLFFNKIAGAALAALLLFFGLPQIANMLMGGGHHGGAHDAHGHPFPQYPVAFMDESAGGAVEEGPSLPALLAAASASGGERRSAICKSCHTFEKGGANGTGPNLWGVVGRQVASVGGYNYSGALQSFGGEWTYERLDAYIANSQELVPGTAMAQRIQNPAQRADLLAYLQSVSDNPVPFPAAPEAEAAGDAEAHGGDHGE